MEDEVIFEEWSPVGDIQAFVEKSDLAYYFYLWINPHSEHGEMRSCWICNRVTAPDTFDVDDMKGGQAPRMPKEFINHDLAGIELEADGLNVQWFEEGDAAALLMGEKIIAVIPCFSGYKGFSGYSIYAKGMGQYAWALENAYSRFMEKVEEARIFWAHFDQESYWTQTQEFHMQALEQFMGPYEKYYAIDGGEFPPKALIQGRKGGAVYGITAGVSLIPMPKVELAYQNEYKDYRRMELGFACKEENEKNMMQMLGVMSGISNLPWSEQTFLGHGHTVPFSGIDGFSYILFLNARKMDCEISPQYEECMGEKVNLLWMKLITEQEYQLEEEVGIEKFLEMNPQLDILN